MSSLSASMSRHTTLSKKSEIVNEIEHQSSIKSKSVYQIKVDPTRAFEPVRKKLTTLETQRIMGVLDMTIKQSEVITALPSALINLEDLSIVLTRQLVFLMNKYKDIKDNLDVLYSKLDIIRGIRMNRKQELDLYERDQSLASDDFWTTVKSSASGSRNGFNEFGFVEVTYTEEEINEFKEQEHVLRESEKQLINELKFAVRCLLIGFRTNPAATKALISTEKNWKIKRGPGDQKFVSKLKQLKDIMTMKLMTTPAERDEKYAYLRQTNERDKVNRAFVFELENELIGLKDRKDKEIQDRNEIIRKLQAEIHHIEKVSEENTKKTILEMERQKENDERNSESVCQKLQQEIFQKKAVYNNILTEARQAEKEQRSFKYKLESTLETNLQSYDSAMGDLQTQYESIDEEYTREKTELHEMDEKFKTLEEEYLKIMEEKRIEEEKREAARREEEILTKAIVTIQSFWRSYKVRKGIRGKKKGKGKGKKK